MAEPETLRRFHGHPAYLVGPDVWAVLRGRFGMSVFSSFSDPHGTFNGGPGEEGCMETTFMLPGADYPLIGARTTWTIDPEKPHHRIDEKHEYFLFVAKKEEA